MEATAQGNTEEEDSIKAKNLKPEKDYSKNNIFSKIDDASHNRNVEYVLEVLKSDDMLYVSRAIKSCTWLITDQQYAHIINPEYLNCQLFPHMTPESSSKLEQNIKLHLKDETRVEAFYNYYYHNDKNPQAAFKWLPNCSRTFIDTEVQNNADKIKRPLIKRLINAPSLKQGSPLSSTEQNCEELKQNWKSTKSPKIKVSLFKKTFNLLIKEESLAMIAEIWQLLSMFFDDLPHNESKQLINILINVRKVPLIVRVNFYVKSFKLLKSLPASECIMKSIADHSRCVMEFLDEEVASEIAKNYQHVEIISAFLLCAKDETTQIRRYERILVPLLERSFNSWEVKGSYSIRKMVEDLLKQLKRDITVYVFEKNMIFPIKMFADIQKQLEERLSIAKNYVMLTYWKLAVSIIKILENHKALVSMIRETTAVRSPDVYFDDQFDETWKEVYNKASTNFAKTCALYLKEDVKNYGPSIYLLFAEALREFATKAMLKYMLEDKQFIESYLLVIKLCPPYFLERDEEISMDENEIEIRKQLRIHPSTEVKLHYEQEIVTWDKLI